MSAPGRPKRELLPLGGKARSAKGAPMSETGKAKARRARRRAIAAADASPLQLQPWSKEAAA